MDRDRNPGVNVPARDPAQGDKDEPRSDRGGRDQNWAPPADEQGVSNRPGDEPEFERDIDLDEEST